MEFCPTCGNMLLYELPNMDRHARFFCPTCPYIAQIENQVKIERHLRLVKKPIAPIFSEGVPANAQKTSEMCPNPDCKNGEVTFTQMQTRSADEPSTIFYYCAKCKSNWTEN